MRAAAVAALLMASAVAADAEPKRAVFTGGISRIQTITGQLAWRCEYTLLGETFWVVMKERCPQSILVE